jgi:hypothetical protein
MRIVHSDCNVLKQVYDVHTLYTLHIQCTNVMCTHFAVCILGACCAMCTVNTVHTAHCAHHAHYVHTVHTIMMCTLHAHCAHYVHYVHTRYIM